MTFGLNIFVYSAVIQDPEGIRGQGDIPTTAVGFGSGFVDSRDSIFIFENEGKDESLSALVGVYDMRESVDGLTANPPPIIATRGSDASILRCDLSQIRGFC